MRPGANLLPSAGSAAGEKIVLHPLEVSDPAGLALWEALIETGESQEKLYQSPGFYRFLQACPDGDDVMLFSVTRQHDGQALGVLPVRFGAEELQLGMGRLDALAPRLRVIRVLGSLPMLGAHPYCAAQWMEALFAWFPTADAISMQAVPQESDWWQNLLPSIRRRAYVYNDWRDCHTIPLPDSFEAYLKQFSSKKRYNLTRQVKQLAQQAGDISVVRVTDAAQVPAMLAAAHALASAPERRGLLSEQEYLALADQGLLLSYMVSCGNQTCGVVVGSLFGGVWHVYKILWDAQYAGLSIGTSVLHLSIQEALESVQPHLIDLGYGSPKRDFHSSHRIVKRGHVLLYRRRFRTRLRISTHAFATRFTAPLREAAKRWRARLDAARTAKSPVS